MNMPLRHNHDKGEYSGAGLIRFPGLRHNAAMSSQRHFLRAWRKFRGYSQVRLAEMIGCDQSVVSKVETFKKPYDQEYLEKAASALSVDVPDLLIRDPTDPDGLWSIYDQLRPVERKQLVEIGKTLKRTGTEG